MRIRDYLTQGWELLIANIVPLLLWTFLLSTVWSIVFLILLAISLIPILGWILAVPLALIFGTVFRILGVGSVIYCIKRLRNESVTFSTFFSGMGDFLNYILLGILSSFLIEIGIGCCCIIPGIYLAITYTLADFFIADQGLDFWPAMEASRKLITRNFFPFLLFLLLLFFINLGGLFLCGLGLLLTLPLTTCMMAVAYMDIMNQGATPAGSTFQ
jgi:uncharacterized membrane protein